MAYRRENPTMINPYTIEVLNAERLKDLDRERAELYLASLARPKRRRAYRPALAWLGDFLTAIGAWLKKDPAG